MAGSGGSSSVRSCWRRNATKYATVAWDPLVVGTIILYGSSKGRTLSVFMATSVLISTGAIDCGILLLGGPNLANGVLRNTIDPWAPAGVPSSVLHVLEHAALMTGLILLIAIAGIWVSVVKRMPPTATAFLCLLALAALLAPIEQARVHEISSLDENMGFGLPFAALGAGYALGRGGSGSGGCGTGARSSRRRRPSSR